MTADVRLIHQAAIDRACADDNAWFALHPGRLFRVRDIVAFEFNEPLEAPPAGMSSRVLVANFSDGAPIRMPCALPLELANDAASDFALASLWETIAPPNAKLMPANMTDALKNMNGPKWLVPVSPQKRPEFR